MNVHASPNAASLSTLAALAIFNGLRLSPLYASPSPTLALLGPRIAPRFNQTRNYLTRFFSERATVHDFNPVEELGEKMAAAQWVRGAVGVLQHALYEEFAMDVPDASDMDPAIWFDGLADMVKLFSEVEDDTVLPEHLAAVLDGWKQPKEAGFPGSRDHYLSALYDHARSLQADGTFLSTVPAIARARASATSGEEKETEKS